MQKNNELKNYPIIDNILILGLKSEELTSIQSSTLLNIQENSSKYKSSILFNYQSPNKINTGPNIDFFTKICELSFPNGVVYSSENINYNKKQIISFCLRDFNHHLKYITCAYIQSGLKIDDGNIIIINTGIALISSIDIFEFHKEILSHFIDIISNYFNVNSVGNLHNKKMKEVYCGNEYFEEYRLIPFYFSFFLNFNLDNNNINNDKIKNICITNLPNNYYQNIFCKINLNPRTKTSILSLKEYDTSILLEKFYIEDILKLYYALLLDKSLIFLFNDHSDINIIINSLLSITYPFEKQRKYTIKYIYNKSQLQSKKLIKKDQLNIIYLIYYTEDDDLSFLPEEGKTPSFISTDKTSENSLYNSFLNFYYYKDTFVYSIKDKKFLNCPFDNEKHRTVFIDEDINDEIKSQLYFIMGEKLAINSDMNFDETDLGLIFDNSICNKINSFLYLNLKIISIFFRGFLMILNGINSAINFNCRFNSDNLSLNEYFDIKNKFLRNNKLRQYLIQNKNFREFIINYIKKYKNNNIYMFIYKTLNEIKGKNFIDMNKYFENNFKEHIRNGIINYYNFDFINLEKCFKDALKYNENNNDKNTKNDFILSPSIKYTLFQLLNIDKKIIEKNNSFYKIHSFNEYLETDTSYLSKFQIYKIYNSFKITYKPRISKLYLGKQSASKIPNSSYFNNFYNNITINTNEENQIDRSMNLQNKINNIPNIDNIFGQILKGENFSSKKPEIIKENQNPKMEIKYKRINKEPSPYPKARKGTVVGRNSSYYNRLNNPFSKNSNYINRRKNLQLSNSKDIKKNTQSFREKNGSNKSKNKDNKNNILTDIENYNDNKFGQRSNKRKNTYNMEGSNQNLKKLGFNKKINNFGLNISHKEVIHGPISSSKKYENNFGHIPKLAGDLDDDLISDED